MDKNNKVIFHICGGGAYSIASHVSNKTLGNDDDFPRCESYYIDTTDINLKSDFLKEKFFKIQSVQSGSSTEVSGSGGDRANHLESKINGIKNYINENKFFSNKQDEYHVVIFTCGGGSGSTLGPALLKELKLKGITTIAICVADSSTAMSASNTLNTLSGIDKIARDLKVNIPMIYLDNNLHGDNITLGERIVNDKITSDINFILGFLSTSKKDLDNADMHLFLDQTKYTNKFATPSGIMELKIVNDEYKESEGKATMCRTLMMEGKESKLDLDFLNKKIGYMTGARIKEKLGDVSPINLITCINTFASRIELLKEVIGSTSKLNIESISSDEDEILF